MGLESSLNGCVVIAASMLMWSSGMLRVEGLTTGEQELLDGLLAQGWITVPLLFRSSCSSSNFIASVSVRMPTVVRKGLCVNLQSTAGL
jgi:hypothetical protein